MFIILIVMMVSQVYTYVKTYQIVYLKYVQSNVNYNSLKLFKKFKDNLLFKVK